MTRLFKCELKCKIKGFPKRVEYLRASSDDVLIRMFNQSENIEGSTYYGYKWTAICSINIKDFPEVKTLKIKVIN